MEQGFISERDPGDEDDGLTCRTKFSRIVVFHNFAFDGRPLGVVQRTLSNGLVEVAIGAPRLSWWRRALRWFARRPR